MDWGISESEFWNMTFGELSRLISSKRRIQKLQAQERASSDYILADLIGKSIARIYSSANTYPSIQETYPTLFDSEKIEEKKQEKQDELSALRFMQFAQSFNKRFQGGVKKS